MAGNIISVGSNSTVWLFDEGGQVLTDEDGTIFADNDVVQGPLPIIVGGLPTVRDGFGGLQGFVRSLSETTTATAYQDLANGITLTGSSLNGSFNTIAFMWNGVYQTIQNFNAGQTLTAPQLLSSTWYLCVQRNYGFSVVWTTTLPQNTLNMCLAQVVIASSAITSVSAYIQTSFGSNLSVHETTVAAALIPTSNADGSMPS